MSKPRDRFELTINDSAIHHAGDRIVGVMRLTFDATKGQGRTDMSIAEVYSFRESKVSGSTSIPRTRN